MAETPPVRIDFRIGDKPISENPLPGWKTLVETEQKGVYHSVPLSALLTDAPEVTIPSLEVVTTEGNSTTKGIRYIGANATGSLRVFKNGIENLDADLSIYSNRNAFFQMNGSDNVIRNAMTIHRDAYIQVHRRNVGTPSKLATFTTAGIFVEASPSDMITAGTGLEWVGNTLRVAGTTTNPDGDWVSKTNGGTFLGRVGFADDIRFHSIPWRIENSDASAAIIGQQNSLSFFAQQVQVLDIYATYAQFNRTLRLDSNANLQLIRNPPYTKMLVLGTNNTVSLQDIPSGGGTYSLPTASDTVKGGIKLNLNHFIISNQVLSLKSTGGYVLPPASSGTRGGITVNGYGLQMVNTDHLRVKLQSGGGLGIDSSGALYATGGTGGVTISGTPSRVPMYNASGNNIVDSKLEQVSTAHMKMHVTTFTINTASSASPNLYFDANNVRRGAISGNATGLTFSSNNSIFNFMQPVIYVYGSSATTPAISSPGVVLYVQGNNLYARKYGGTIVKLA